MTKQYNDGLDNEFVRQIITTHRRPISQKTRDIINDLGTVPSSLVDIDTGEMYYNSNYNCESNRNLNCNTFRPENRTVNVVGKAHEIASEAYGQGASKNQKNHNVLRGNTDQLNLNPNHHYVHIEAQLLNIRSNDNGSRYRAKIYYSLKTIDDTKFSIKLISHLTSNMNEILRQANTVKDNPLIDVINGYKDRGLHELMLGHIKYRSNNGFIGNRERYNHPSALAALYEDQGMLITELWMFHDIYKITLDNDPTSKQNWASKAGSWYYEFGYGNEGYDE